MNDGILATILWLIVILVLPLALTFASVSIWADGATRLGGQPNFNNLLVLLLFLFYTIFWLALLRLVYLPAMGYDPRVIALPGPFGEPFARFSALDQLWAAFTGWVRRDPLGAGARVAMLVVLGGLALFAARFLGELTGRRTRGYR
jgi:hypothetical protein